jgi:2-polyprenyl-3-methyl-5-hydroxy-6-metoxy-1,4-benzoquinol methylase
MSESPIRDTDDDWCRIAADNPYWGVLSVDDFRGKDIPDAIRGKFFASGAAVISDIAGFVRKYIKPEFRPARSLDFGCGVGRLLIPIAKISECAVGVDIAPKMLEIAKANAAAAKVSNIEFVVSDDDFSRVDGQFDFINTYLVLQHIPPERGYRIVAHLLERLAPGGIASFQLTYAKNRQFFAHETLRARYYRREGRTLIDLVDHKYTPPDPGAITMFDYDLNQIFAIASETVGSPILTLPTNDDGHLGLHLIAARA